MKYFEDRTLDRPSDGWMNKVTTSRYHVDSIEKTQCYNRRKENNVNNIQIYTFSAAIAALDVAMSVGPSVALPVCLSSKYFKKF